jgi:3-methyl-2-oxobutanoate hydroxymethyltransferase
VVQGRSSTLPVGVDDIAYHVRAVAAGTSRALLLADLPFQADATPERALDAATRLLQAGAGMVKLEGAGAHKLGAIRFLVDREIPVSAHLGLTPQSVLRFGGFKVQGREAAAAEQLRLDALAVAEAGASLLVLECVPSALAADITRASPIPTIGIGAGPHCDGQVLVLHDMLGLNEQFTPKFLKHYGKLGQAVRESVRTYASEVREGKYPAKEHSFD